MNKVGIVSYGLYIPRLRINRKTISQAVGFLSPYRMAGEKAVTNFDEDVITLAVNAAMTLPDRKGTEGLFFASTCYPYAEADVASLISLALDLPRNTRVANFGYSMKAGTEALISALEAVKSKSLKKVITIASDTKMGRPGSQEELIFGDGAACFEIGDENVIASYEGHFSVSEFFPDYRRLECETYVRFVEDRFFREEGYQKFISDAVEGLLNKYGLSARDITKIGFSCFNQRDYKALATKLGFKEEQIEEALLVTIGETGVASPYFSLISALESAKPGDKIIIAGYGYGADALLFTVEKEIEHFKSRGILKKFIDRRKEFNEYEKYLVFKGIISRPQEPFGEDPPTRIPLLWRERKAIFALKGSRCLKCGTVQYPPQRICVNPSCGAVDESEPYLLADKKATLYSYTMDHIANTPNPPLIFGMLEFEDGARFPFDLTDCEPETVRLEMEMRLSFRLKFVDHTQGIRGYFWKAIPLI